MANMQTCFAWFHMYNEHHIACLLSRRGRDWKEGENLEFKFFNVENKYFLLKNYVLRITNNSWQFNSLKSIDGHFLFSQGQVGRWRWCGEREETKERPEPTFKTWASFSAYFFSLSPCWTYGYKTFPLLDCDMHYLWGNSHPSKLLGSSWLRYLFAKAGTLSNLFSTEHSLL